MTEASVFSGRPESISSQTRTLNQALGTNAIIVGSGAMVLVADAAGKKEGCRAANDIDVVVTERSFRHILDNRPANSQLHKNPYNEGTLLRLHPTTQDGAVIDIGPHWDGKSYEEIAQHAHNLGGISVASTVDVLSFKEKRRALKDLPDIRFIGTQLLSFADDEPSAPPMVCTLKGIFGKHYAQEANLATTPGLLQATKLSVAQKAQLDTLAQQGISIMTRRHGAGAPTFAFDSSDPEARRLLAYNNGRHAREITEDTNVLGKKLGLSELELYALSVGAAWHDSDQTAIITNSFRDGSDELRSAQEIVDHLRRANQPLATAAIAAYFIYGTQVKTEGKNVVGQMGRILQEQDFPTKKAELYTRFGASCDLGRLFSPQSPLTASYLLEQRHMMATGQKIDLGKEGDRKMLHGHLLGQVAFLSGYQYPLKEAAELWSTHRTAVTKHNEKLATLDIGDLPDTWKDFLAINRQFASELQAA